MDVQLQYFDGCPSWRAADQRLREAIAAAGVEVTPTYVRVTSSEEAERLRFRGSPTLLVDGIDPFDDGTAEVGLSCRLFDTPDGLRGAPTTTQVLAALRRAAESTQPRT